MKTTIKMALAAVALSFATFSQAEVASSSEHGFQIQLEQSFEGSAQQGYRHFINNVSEWWLDDHTWFGDNKVSLNYIVGGYPTTDFTKLAPIVDGVLAQQLASFSQTL